ncbi:uncharacterized protein LOC143909853 [Arctopsyche grandis]|uniref:uncharacterized protein LOC143909853 n=1 Tax=Arctopsyche grandis TaxID=121162 RepID=UPI00406DA236
MKSIFVVFLILAISNNVLSSCIDENCHKLLKKLHIEEDLIKEICACKKTDSILEHESHEELIPKTIGEISRREPCYMYKCVQECREKGFQSGFCHLQLACACY